MKKDAMHVLEDLCLTPSPSGFESEIAWKLMDYLKPYCASVEMDNVGNVIGKINGKDSSLKPVLVYAHMDRIGFVVSNIREDGYLILEKVGAVPDKVLPGLTLAVRTSDEANWLPVVAGTKCQHLMTPQEQNSVEPLGRIMIDVGADNEEQVRAMGIDIGCPGVYTPAFHQLNETRVCGTALDNCGSVTALIGIAQQLSENQPERDVYIAGSVWEEYNQRAAAMMVRRFSPIVAISMDMLLAADTPDVKGRFRGTLGEGPMVSAFNFYDHPLNGTIPHPGLLKLTVNTAGELGTGIQKYATSNSMGDSAYSQLQADGPACMEIGAPVRYAHSSCEVADIRDIENLSKLVAGVIVRIDKNFKQCRF